MHMDYVGNPNLDPIFGSDPESIEGLDVRNRNYGWGPLSMTQGLYVMNRTCGFGPLSMMEGLYVRNRNCGLGPPSMGRPGIFLGLSPGSEEHVEQRLHLSKEGTVRKGMD